MLNAKKVSDSSLTSVRMMMPPDANPNGYVYGGTILKYVDEIAWIVAQRHCRMECVTASLDRLDFHERVYIGDLLILKASANYVGRTSMEVGVRVEAEDLKTGRRVHTGSAYLTFVAIDERGDPVEVPHLIPETKEEKRRFREGEERRRKRLAKS